MKLYVIANMTGPEGRPHRIFDSAEARQRHMEAQPPRHWYGYIWEMTLCDDGRFRRDEQEMVGPDGWFHHYGERDYIDTSASVLQRELGR